MPKVHSFFGCDQYFFEREIKCLSLQLFNNTIACIGGPKHVTTICTHNASSYKSVGLLLQDKYNAITWVPCAIHTLSLLLKDIGKMSFVQLTLLNANHVVKFV